jgi:hypothetical protein
VTQEKKLSLAAGDVVMMDHVGCVGRDDPGRRMHWTTRKRTGWMEMIVDEVDIVGKLETEMTRRLVGGVEGGGGDGARTSWRVFGGSNLRWPASISEGGWGDKKFVLWRRWMSVTG